MVNRNRNSLKSQRETQRSTELEQAIREIARRCVFLIRGCLREEEWQDARSEFERIIRHELEQLGQPLIK